MGIRVQHQGAGAGSGIDDGFKRKYDLRLKQLDKQQDRMFQIGLQNRDVALQRENMLIGNNMRAGERQAVRDAEQANWMRNQKAVDDQRNLAAANNRATLKGSIQAGIDAGEFEKKDIDLINKAFSDADVILSDAWKGDDAQKFAALAENQGKLLALAQRQRPRAPQAPVPWEQADPKVQQGLIDSAYKRLQTHAEQSGELYSDADAMAMAQAQYSNMTGGGQSPQAGSAPQQQIPARGSNVTPFGVPALPSTPPRMYGKRPSIPEEPKPILSWDKAIELATQKLTQGDNPSPITQDALHAEAKGFYDKFNSSGQQRPTASGPQAPIGDPTIPPPPIPGQPRSAEPMGQPGSSAPAQATEVPGQFAYGQSSNQDNRLIGGRPVSDLTSQWGQFVDELTKAATSHARQDKTLPPELERRQLPPQNQPPIKWDPRFDAFPDAPPIEWGDGKFVNQHSRQKTNSMSPRMQEIKKHYDTLSPDAQNMFRHAMGINEQMRNSAIARLKQEGKDGGLFGGGPANPDHQQKLYGVGGGAETVQEFFNKTPSTQASTPQAPLPRAASLNWAGLASETDPVKLKRLRNAEAAYNSAVDDTAKNAIALLLTAQPPAVQARAAKILKDKYGIVLSEVMSRQ